LLALHFAVDAVDVLGPARNLGVDPFQSEVVPEEGDVFFNVGLPFRCPGLQFPDDFKVDVRLEVPEGQVFQFPFQRQMPSRFASGA
jgi:hypothetical protein